MDLPNSPWKPFCAESQRWVYNCDCARQNYYLLPVYYFLSAVSNWTVQAWEVTSWKNIPGFDPGTYEWEVLSSISHQERKSWEMNRSSTDRNSFYFALLFVSLRTLYLATLTAHSESRHVLFCTVYIAENFIYAVTNFSSKALKFMFI